MPIGYRRKKYHDVEVGSGNVFADLGLPNPEERLAKATLAHRICKIMTARRLTQTKAAVLFGVDQPKVSALVRGQLRGFSAERLFGFLNALGQDVEITIRDAEDARAASTKIVV